MSAYRNKPAPPRWRIIYQMPFVERVGRGAVLGGFGVLTMSALLAFCLVAGAGMGASAGLIGLSAFAVMVFVTGSAVGALHWLTSFAGVAECTIGELRTDSNNENYCRVESGKEQWLLPLRSDRLREGQTIRVRYRDSAPDGAATSEREILEIKLIEE